MTHHSFSSLDELLQKHGLNDRAVRDLDSAALVGDIYNKFSFTPRSMLNQRDILNFLPFPDLSGLILRVTKEDERTTTQLYAPHNAESYKIKIIRDAKIYQKPNIIPMSHMEKFQLASIRFNKDAATITDAEFGIQRIVLSPDTAKTLVF